MAAKAAFYIPCFSPESRESSVCTWQVFWLAPVEHLPITFYCNSGLKIQQTCIDKRSTRRAYSYGDSAGFTPDFPFNPPPEAEEPNTQQMYRQDKHAAKFIHIKFFTTG
jgi:hypothetical protein